MNRQQHILVVDDMATSTKMMSVMLTHANYEVTAFNNSIEAFQWLQLPANQPDLIVTDLNMPGLTGTQLARQIRKIDRLTYVPILVLSAITDKTQVLASLQAGANDYMLKPVRAHDLVQRVESLLNRVEDDTAPGQSADMMLAMATFSLRGGVGTTSLAVNLAIAFQQLWGKNTLLFDVASKNSHSALWLGLKPKKTLANLAQSNGTHVTATNVESLLLKHNSGISVLPAPIFAYDSAKITDAMIADVWTVLSKKFTFIVVDAGSDVTPAAYAAMTRCHNTLLVLTPEKGSLAAAEYAINLAKQLKYNTSNIVPVLNQLFPSGGLSQNVVEDTLHQPIKSVIPHDAVGFVDAINSATPLVMANPMAEASMAIAKLAYELSPDGLKLDVPEDASELLKNVQKQVA